MNLNFENTYLCNRASIMVQASTFGLDYLGDDATIQGMLMLNMMVICGDASPIVLSICDCTKCMSECGKKDNNFIAEMFRKKLII